MLGILAGPVGGTEGITGRIGVEMAEAGAALGFGLGFCGGIETADSRWEGAVLPSNCMRRAPGLGLGLGLVTMGLVGFWRG